MEIIERVDNFGLNEIILLYKNDDNESRYEFIPRLMEFY